MDGIKAMLRIKTHKCIDHFINDDSKVKNTLPPNFTGAYTKATLIKDDQNRDMQISWGPMYNLSR